MNRIYTVDIYRLALFYDDSPTPARVVRVGAASPERAKQLAEQGHEEVFETFEGALLPIPPDCDASVRCYFESVRP